MPLIIGNTTVSGSLEANAIVTSNLSVSGSLEANAIVTSNLSVNGQEYSAYTPNLSIRYISSSYTIEPSDTTIILRDTPSGITHTSGPYTITLPVSSGTTDGRQITIYNTCAESNSYVSVVMADGRGIRLLGQHASTWVPTVYLGATSTGVSETYMGGVSGQWYGGTYRTFIKGTYTTNGVGSNPTEAWAILTD